MKWLTKIHNWFGFVRSDLKKYSKSWSLMSLGFIMAGFATLIVFVSLSKTSIFPKENDRYDIDTIYVGQMKDFCPKEFEANPREKEFEACISKLDINKMVEVKVPTFKETLKLAPNLPYMMKNSSNPKIRAASKYFTKGNYFVIGIKVPENFFSTNEGYLKNGNLNKETTNYNSLTFKAIRFGFACVNGQCNTILTGFNANVSQIPLIRDKNNTSGDNTVWVFGTENDSPHGIFLEDGILISSTASLYPAHFLYPFHIWGKPMFASLAFAALFVISLFCAIILRKFFDYPAFSYFTGSTAFWFLSSNLLILFPWLTGFKYQLLDIWLTLNFLFSVLILNLAYARFKSILNRKYIILFAHIVILTLVSFVYVYFKDLGALIAVRARLDLIFACTAIMFSLGPLGFGIKDLSKLLKNLKGDPRLSIRLDYKRRRRELRSYFFVWLIFGSSYLYFAYAGLGTGNVGEFFSLSIGLILLLLTIMLYYTYSKELTRVTSDPLAELERLSKRKSTSELSEIVKQPFKGILLLLDMANSSGKDGHQKRIVMEGLLRICNMEANKCGFYANYVKPAGDDWKIIFINKKDQTLEKDLLEIRKFVDNNYNKFEKCVKDVFEDSSLHTSVFALCDYRIYVDEKLESESGYRMILDFSSKEADLMLKYIEKSKVPGTFMVAGNSRLWSDELKSFMLENKTHSLKDEVLEKHKKLATELDIVYGLAILNKNDQH